MARGLAALEAAISPGGGPECGPAGREKPGAAAEDTVCSICLDGMNADSDAWRLTCGHRFHTACIVKALRRSSKCPYCRDDPEKASLDDEDDDVFDIAAMLPALLGLGRPLPLSFFSGSDFLGMPVPLPPCPVRRPLGSRSTTTSSSSDASRQLRPSTDPAQHTD